MQAISSPVQLSKLIKYQDGSVVSREIIKKPTGTITLFAFAKDQGLSEHTTPYDALVLILDGEAKITLGGAVHHLKNGETLLMPANIPHALYALQNFKMLLTMIKS